MWPRFSLNDLRVIGHYLGVLILLIAATMAVPLIVALIMQEWAVAVNYGFGIGVALVAGSLLRMLKISPASLNRKQAAAVTGLAWLFGAIIAAVPLYLSGHFLSFFDAIFEGMSGLTATGFTLIRDLDHLSTADNMWRFILQFMGGQGIIVAALSLGLFAKAGSTMYSTEGRSEHILPNIRQTASFIWRFSLVVVGLGTVVLFVVCLARGFEPARAFFHGLWLTIASYDTGGFCAQSTGILYYHSTVIEFIVMVFMLMGIVNFTLYAELRKGHWKEFFKDIEIRTQFLWITLMVVIFTAATVSGTFFNDFGSLLRRGVFTIVSAAANGGFQVLSSTQMVDALTTGSFFMIALAMAIGGSAGSTAGGIKALRLGLIAKDVVARLKAALSPESARSTSTYYHVGNRVITSELTSAAFVVTVLYAISYVAGAVIAVALGYDAVAAMFESVSATSNAGLSAGIVGVGMPRLLKVVYFLQMWLGRLEFLTLLAIIVAFIVSLKPRKSTRKSRKKKKEQDSAAARSIVTGTRSMPVVKPANYRSAGQGTSRGTAVQGASKGATQGTAVQGASQGATRTLAAGHGKGNHSTPSHHNAGQSTSKFLVLALVVGLSLTLAAVPLAQAEEISDTKTTTQQENQEDQNTGTNIGTDTDANAEEQGEQEASKAGPTTTGKVGAAEATARDAKVGSSSMALINISDLLAGDQSYDENSFQFSGEAVGDIIDAGKGYMWVTVSDGVSAISVYMKESDAALITELGRYESEGTTLLISGTFHLNCDAHSGETDFHASSVSVLQSGHEYSEHISYEHLYVAVGLLVLGALLLLLTWRLRERLR